MKGLEEKVLAERAGLFLRERAVGAYSITTTIELVVVMVAASLVSLRRGQLKSSSSVPQSPK